MANGTKWAWRLDIAVLVRHHDCMDRRALERLGHHVVSRRVALGYRNRTDLAGSLQFTVRTLADIEHGVRKASPGTYAILENKLGWAPGSIDTILAGGEPKELVPNLRRGHPRPRPGYACHRRPVACLHRGVTAGATTAHHRPPHSTPRHLGRLGRRPGPARRLARRGLAASTLPIPCPTQMRFAASFAVDTVRRLVGMPQWETL